MSENTASIKSLIYYAGIFLLLDFMAIIIYQAAYYTEHREIAESDPLVGTHETACMCNSGPDLPSPPQKRKDIDKVEQGQWRPLVVVRAGALDL